MSFSYRISCTNQGNSPSKRVKKKIQLKNYTQKKKKNTKLNQLDYKHIIGRLSYGESYVSFRHKDPLEADKHFTLGKTKPAFGGFLSTREFS